VGPGSASPETGLLELQSRRVFPNQFNIELYSQYFYYKYTNEEYTHNQCFSDIDAFLGDKYFNEPQIY